MNDSAQNASAACLAEHLLAEQASIQECAVTISAGAGGTEASEWAGMLKLMYTNWANRHQFEITRSDESISEGRLHRASVKLRGRYVYGWLKGEMGIHRLVRISPHDSQGRRHTSFASVDVWPVHEGQVIKPQEIERDTSAAVPDNFGIRGYQIRSYVLHPYQLAKDLRTDYETDDTDAVLNGCIDEFLAAYVLMQAERERAVIPAHRE